MKKIIWISSYPKSGNTWVRYFLCNYFFNDSWEDLNFEILKNIDKFPPYEYLKKIVDEKIILNNAYNISKYWIKIQKEVTKIKKNYLFYKNHNSLVSIEGNEFTNDLFSLAAIYIVRDPRDVLISYLNFDSTLTMKEGFKRLTNEQLYCHVSKKNSLDVEVLGSWKFNYISWRDGVKNMPRLIIKYEDLVNDTYNTMLKVIIFLSNLINSKIDHEKIKFSIKQSSFQRLQKLENTFGFEEISSTNKFFNSGKINQWKNQLTKDQIYFIENTFKEEMKELNYI